MQAYSESSVSEQHRAQVQFWRAVCVGLLLSLIVLGVAWEWLLAPLRPGGSTLVVKVLPLSLAVAGLLKHKLYTYRWLSLLVWLYVAEGLVRGYSDKPVGNYLALLEAALAFALFVACARYIRLRLRARLTPRTETDAT